MRNTEGSTSGPGGSVNGARSCLRKRKNENELLFDFRLISITRVFSPTTSSDWILRGKIDFKCAPMEISMWLGGSIRVRRRPSWEK